MVVPWPPLEQCARVPRAEHTLLSSSRCMRVVSRSVTLLLVWLLASSASAQVAEGRRQLEAASFTRAIRAFDRAERGAHLTRDDLVAIYEGRAMARWATGAERQAQRDLAALAELDPQHAFPPEAPPELGEAFAEGAREGGLAIELSFADETGATTMSVDVHRDGMGLVHSLRTHVRVADGEWSDSDASSLHLDVPEHASVEAWVEAIGPGGAIVATSGSADAPIVHGGRPVPELEVPTPAPAATSLFVRDTPNDSHDESGLWIGLGVGIGAAVLVAVIVGIAVGVSSGPSDHTQPDVPVIRW